MSKLLNFLRGKEAIVVKDDDADLRASFAAEMAAETARADAAEMNVQASHQMLRSISEKQAAGQIVEFEYGHIPRKRDINHLPHMKRAMVEFKALEPGFMATLSGFNKYLDKAMEIEATAINPTDPSWNNPWFPFIDAISTYCLIATHKPRRYIEVGSGFSTKFARRAIRDFSPDTKIVSIDPYPRDEINDICDEIMRMPLENVDGSFFETLTKDDIFFLDSSHRVDQGSDVSVFFAEILPNFPKGMLYGIHDIFHPDDDYPDTWLHRHYAEQYMLMAYLFGGAGGDEIVLPGYYVSRRKHLYGVFDRLLQHENVKPSTSWVLGTAFWMRKA